MQNNFDPRCSSCREQTPEEFEKCFTRCERDHHECPYTGVCLMCVHNHVLHQDDHCIDCEFEE